VPFGTKTHCSSNCSCDTRCLMQMHRVEPTRLQQLALQFAERAATFVENNEVIRRLFVLLYFVVWLHADVFVARSDCSMRRRAATASRTAMRQARRNLPPLRAKTASICKARYCALCVSNRMCDMLIEQTRGRRRRRRSERRSTHGGGCCAWPWRWRRPRSRM
jgi:hypothetical protein